MREKIAVSYSFTQKAVHVESLNEFIEHNFKIMFDGKEPNYHLISICDTDEEASIMCDYVKKLIRQDAK